MRRIRIRSRASNTDRAARRSPAGLAAGDVVLIKSWKRIYHEGDAVAEFEFKKGRLPETLAELKELEAQ